MCRLDARPIATSILDVSMSASISTSYKHILVTVVRIFIDPAT